MRLVLMALAVLLTCTVMVFGFDREVARWDYNKHQGPVKGCLWDINCEYYNNMEKK